MQDDKSLYLFLFMVLAGILSGYIGAKIEWIVVAHMFPEPKERGEHSLESSEAQKYGCGAYLLISIVFLLAGILWLAVMSGQRAWEWLGSLFMDIGGISMGALVGLGFMASVAWWFTEGVVKRREKAEAKKKDG